jgi:hypothetical protein
LWSADHSLRNAALEDAWFEDVTIFV